MRHSREEEVLLAILNGATDIIDELNDGALADSAGLDPVVELSRQHRVLSQHSVGKHETVPFLRISDGLDIQDLNQRLRVQVPGVYRRNRVLRQIHRHVLNPRKRRGREREELLGGEFLRWGKWIRL